MQGRGGQGGYSRRRHRDSQWQGFSVLFARKTEIFASTLALWEDQTRVVSALFKRTSEIELALLERIEIGQGILDELRGEPHCGGSLPRGCSVAASVVGRRSPRVVCRRGKRSRLVESRAGHLQRTCCGLAACRSLVVGSECGGGFDVDKAENLGRGRGEILAPSSATKPPGQATDAGWCATLPVPVTTTGTSYEVQSLVSGPYIIMQRIIIRRCSRFRPGLLLEHY